VAEGILARSRTTRLCVGSSVSWRREDQQVGGTWALLQQSWWQKVSWRDPGQPGSELAVVFLGEGEDQQVGGTWALLQQSWWQKVSWRDQGQPGCELAVVLLGEREVNRLRGTWAQLQARGSWED